MRYRKRFLESKVLDYLEVFPVVGLTGPRQSGKSTLLKHLLAKEYRYFSFDTQTNRDLFYDDPVRFMQQYDNKVILDEVQKVPELFEYIKVAVDDDRSNYGKFVITGSAQFAFLNKVTESLAGRIGLLTLLPFQYAELPVRSRQYAVFKGSYPEPVLLNYKHSEDWFSSYIDTYLERDVRDIANIGDLRDFRRLLSLLAANSSQVLNMSRYANDLGVSVPTIKRWLSVLEASYIIFFLPPYFKNYGKRIVKNPKVYFWDTGLVAYLTGILSKDLFTKGPMYGALFENYVVSEIIKREIHQKNNVDFYYYRTSSGNEVDLIIDRKVSRELIEIKASHTFVPKMVKEIDVILKEDDSGYLLYNGPTMDYGKDFKVMRYDEYLST